MDKTLNKDAPDSPAEADPSRAPSEIHVTKGLAAGDGEAPTRLARLVSYCEKRLATFVALLLSVAALFFVPQIKNIVLQIPWLEPPAAGGSALMTVAFRLYVVGLAAFFFVGAMWVFVPSEDRPRWMQRQNFLSRMMRRLCDRLITLARFPLEVPSSKRPTLRRVMYGGLLLASVTLGLMGILGLLPLPWKARDPGPTIVASLALSVAVLGFIGPRLLSKSRSWERAVEVLTRGAVMSLGSYFLAELLWGVFIPLIPEASFRLYTIWAIYHLLFVLVSLARALDLIENVFLRTAFTLGLAAGVLGTITLVPGQDDLAPVELAADTPTDQDAVFTRWIDAANHRLEQMCPGPVIFVSAAGGGSRAAIFAMPTLESLSRMPFDAPASCHAQRLSDHILFISSVSGGSVASAHFASLIASGKMGERIPNEVPLKHAPREELAAQLLEGACKLKPDQLWPLNSAALDAMFVDFNAPLLRGVVMPGVSRGGSLASFWADSLNWDSRLPVDGRVPLLFVNTASARSGERIVTGKPPLPDLMVSDDPEQDARARSISALSVSSDIALADAVRASANFPWVVDLPGVVTPGGQREFLIDGGVFDNTGIDTFVLFLRSLTDNERWQENPEAQMAITRFFASLAERGVLFVEVDSGAKPPSLDEHQGSGGSLIAPISALSRASHAFARNMADYQMVEIGRILMGKNVFMRQVSYDYGDVRLPPEASDEQRQCVEENQDEVMTAWALGPRDKGRLLGQFLFQEKEVSNQIAEHIKNLNWEVQARRSLTRSSTLPSLTPDATALKTRLRDAVDWELADQMLKERVSLQQLGGPRLYEKDAPPVQLFSNTAEDAPGLAARLGAGRDTAWVFVGQYQPESKSWSTCYYCDPDATAWAQDPRQLKGATIVSTTPSLLRETPPELETAMLGRTLGALKVGQRLDVEEVSDWDGRGYIWAKVRIASDKTRKP